MKIKQEPIFHTIPDEEFVDRQKEINNVYQLALESSNNTTNSIYLYGKRKIGKTEVLKRVYSRLFWEQDKIIPFYYTFHKGFLEIHEFAKDYLKEFVRQYLGFVKKQPSLIRKNISFHKLLNLIKDEEYPALKTLIENYHEYMRDNDHLEALKNSISAPYVVSVEGFERVFVILDDFHRIKSIVPAKTTYNLAGEFSKVLNNRFAPHLITGYSIKMRNEIFNDEFIVGESDIMELKGLPKKDVFILFENLCNLYDVKFSKKNIPLMADQFALNTFHIKSFIRSVKNAGADISSLKEFQKLYINEITSGSIGFYLSSILNTFVGEREKRLAIKILKACTEITIKDLTIDFLAHTISSGLKETTDTLYALQEGGLLEMDYGRTKNIKDPVLRDYILFTHSTVIMGLDPSVVKAQMIRDGLKAHTNRNKLSFFEDIKIPLEKVLDSFDCQKVPEVLFDFSSFSSIYCDTESDRVLEILKADKDVISLPQIIGVFEISSIGYASLPDTPFLLSYGFEEGNYEEEKEIIWICGIFSSRSLIRIDEVKEFKRKVDKIKKKMGNLKTVLWIVGKDDFDDKALEEMANSEIKSSSLTQLNHLKNLLLTSKTEEEKEKDALPEIEDGTATGAENEFELTIPMASNTELVAVRAIEEIARRADFDQDAIGQIKMALIEACINATEHSKIRGGKINLKFIIEHDKLLVYVYNEGMGFDPSLIEDPDIDKKVFSSSKRGWGIKLMKSFMDEVTFEKSNGGTKLKMIKFIRK